MSSNSNNPRPTLQNTLFKTKLSPHKRYTITFPENSPVTKQSFKDECDINLLMSRYQNTGQLPNLNEKPPQYLDASGMEFQSAMEFVAGAQTMFQELPSSIRNRFKNDPAEFLDFVSNENNRPELAQMGLLRDGAPSLIPNLTPVETNGSKEPPASPA